MAKKYLKIIGYSEYPSIIKAALLLMCCPLIVSCWSHTEKCDLEPIPFTVFDLDHVKSQAVKNGNETDSIRIYEKIDSYEETSFGGIMNRRECGHYKGYKARFKDYTIDVSLRKNADETLELDVIALGSCGKFIIYKVTEDKLKPQYEHIFEAEPDCEAPNSIFKKVVLRGYLIKSVTTADGKTWEVQ